MLMAELIKTECKFIQILSIRPKLLWCSDRVFILGPSHHFYTDSCVLSTVDAFRTPLGMYHALVSLFRSIVHT